MAENLHGLARGIHYDAAVLTMLQVALKFAHKLGIKLAVDVFRDFIDDLSASHYGHPFRNTWSIPRATSVASVIGVSSLPGWTGRAIWQSPRSRTSLRPEERRLSAILGPATG